jgi:hypothetical protein
LTIGDQGGVKDQLAATIRFAGRGGDGDDVLFAGIGGMRKA